MIGLAAVIRRDPGDAESGRGLKLSNVGAAGVAGTVAVQGHRRNVNVASEIRGRWTAKRHSGSAKMSETASGGDSSQTYIFCRIGRRKYRQSASRYHLPGPESLIDTVIFPLPRRGLVHSCVSALSVWRFRNTDHVYRIPRSSPAPLYAESQCVKETGRPLPRKRSIESRPQFRPCLSVPLCPRDNGRDFLHYQVSDDKA